ncbi:MAG: class I SAM-dependent methyltransferase [Candidatus Gottesmanbacteria bacterium]
MNLNFKIPDNLTRGYGLFENFLAKKRAQKADKLIDNNLRSGRILDIGCGSYPYFLSLTRFQEKYGLDNTYNHEIINNQKINILKLDIEQTLLPFPDQYFDVVTMLAFIEHVNPDRLPILLQEIKRVLKKNGQLIITTPPSWVKRLLFVLSIINFVSKVEIKDHKNSFTEKSLVGIVEKANFPSEKIRCGLFLYHLNRWLTARK